MCYIFFSGCTDSLRYLWTNEQGRLCSLTHYCQHIIYEPWNSEITLLMKNKSWRFTWRKMWLKTLAWLKISFNPKPCCVCTCTRREPGNKGCWAQDINWFWLKSWSQNVVCNVALDSDTHYPILQQPHGSELHHHRELFWIDKEKGPPSCQFIMQSPLDGSILGRTLWGHHWTLPFQPLWWASFFPYEEDGEMNLCLHWAGPEKIHQLIA